MSAVWHRPQEAFGDFITKRLWLVWGGIGAPQPVWIEARLGLYSAGTERGVERLPKWRWFKITRRTIIATWLAIANDVSDQ